MVLNEAKNTKDKRFENAYSALGAMGQSISIFPNIDTVVAFKTKAVYQRITPDNIQLEVLKKAIELYNLY